MKVGKERGNDVISTPLAILLALSDCSFGSALGDCSGLFFFFFLAVYGSYSMLVQALLWLILVNLTQTRDSSKERTSGDELLSSDWLVGKPMGLLL